MGKLFTFSRFVNRRPGALALRASGFYNGLKCGGKNASKEVDNITTDYLLHQEVDAVLSALTEGNRLALSVALRTGLRIGDVLTLRKDQIGLHFWVTESKTGKRRQVGLPQELVTEIKRHSESIRPGSVWAFPGRPNYRNWKEDRHRTRQAVWKDVKRVAAAYRIKGNAGPHSFRKVYAVDLLAKYGDIDRVQRALKHKYQSTTLIYAMADARLQTRKSRRSARR